MKDVALVSKLAAQLYTYLGLGGCRGRVGDASPLARHASRRHLQLLLAVSTRRTQLSRSQTACPRPCTHQPCAAPRLAVDRQLLAAGRVFNVAHAWVHPNGRLLLPVAAGAALGAVRAGGGLWGVWAGGRYGVGASSCAVCCIELAPPSVIRTPLLFPQHRPATAWTSTCHARSGGGRGPAPPSYSSREGRGRLGTRVGGGCRHGRQSTGRGHVPGVEDI